MNVENVHSTIFLKNLIDNSNMLQIFESNDDGNLIYIANDGDNHFFTLNNKWRMINNKKIGCDNSRWCNGALGEMASEPYFALISLSTIMLYSLFLGL